MTAPTRYEVSDYTGPTDPRRWALVRDRVASPIASEDDVRDLIARLTAWLDAPRLAARETAEVVARDDDYVLVRTAFEWGAGILDDASPSDDAPVGLRATVDGDWYTGPDAERNARADYATARSKALCICGAEEDEDEIDNSGDEPLCRKCVAEAQEEFKSQPMRCTNGPCGWTGTGADLIAAGPGSPHECPKCCGWTVYEADDATGGGQ